MLEPAAVVVAHLSDMVRAHAADLLTRQQVHQLLDHLRLTAPRVVDELVPAVVTASQVHRVLVDLLREGLPIRDLEAILVAMADSVATCAGPAELTECVRGALARTICQQVCGRDRVLKVLALTRPLEATLADGLSFSRRGIDVSLEPMVVESIVDRLTDHVRSVSGIDARPIVLCAEPLVRAGLKEITSARLPRLTVLSRRDIPREVHVEAVAHIDLDELPAQRSASRVVVGSRI